MDGVVCPPSAMAGRKQIQLRIASALDSLKSCVSLKENLYLHSEVWIPVAPLEQVYIVQHLSIGMDCYYDSGNMQHFLAFASGILTGMAYGNMNLRFEDSEPVFIQRHPNTTIRKRVPVQSVVDECCKLEMDIQEWIASQDT